MGGNVKITNPSTGKSYKVDKPDFRLIDRGEFKRDFVNAFKKIDDFHANKFKTAIWPKKTRDALLNSGEAFNGSSEHLFGNRLSDDELTEYKPTFGDIDLTVPKEHYDTIFSLLDALTGKKINPTVSYVDKKEGIGGEQINCLFTYTPKGSKPIYVQIDFEFVDYQKGKPDEFAKFGHSSSWEDTKSSVKGVFHKYMLRCLATVVSIQKDVVLLTRTSPLEPIEKIKVSKVTEPVRLLSFSVDRGLRTKFTQQFHADGSPVLVNGMRAYKEIPTGDDVKTRAGIFTLLFGIEPEGNELTLLDSFVGILQLLADHFDDNQIEEVYLDFIKHKLYGKEGQALDATSSEGDKTAKMPAIAVFRDKFPFLEKYDGLVEKLQEDFYKTYKIRTESLLRRLVQI